MRNDVRKVVVDRGLGLVIARAIVERHEGTISLAAHRGPGTTFVICLPVKPTT